MPSKSAPDMKSAFEVLAAAAGRHKQQWEIAEALYLLWNARPKGTWRQSVAELGPIFGRLGTKSLSIERQARRYVEAWSFWMVEHGFEKDRLFGFSPALLGDIAWTGSIKRKTEAERILKSLESEFPPSRNELLAGLRRNSPNLEARSHPRPKAD